VGVTLRGRVAGVDGNPRIDGDAGDGNDGRLPVVRSGDDELVPSAIANRWAKATASSRDCRDGPVPCMFASTFLYFPSLSLFPPPDRVLELATIRDSISLRDTPTTGGTTTWRRSDGGAVGDD